MEFVDKFYSSLHSNKIVSTILTTFLIVYGSMASPNLPGFIRKMFENKIFKILILSLVVYSSNKDPKFAIMMALIFTITLTFIDQKNFFEKFTQPSENCTQFKETNTIDPNNWRNDCCCARNDANHVETCIGAIDDNLPTEEAELIKNNYTDKICI